jgi:signal-transduction protein with cAMP-binding, CBS, and nucleotidyltransferase domain
MLEDTSQSNGAPGTATAEATLDALRRAPIFHACADETLAQVAGLLDTLHAQAGDVIFKEGDAGDVMYIVMDGYVRVVSDVATEKVVFAHLGPGEPFGETALVAGTPRSAGVIATTDARLWVLDKHGFELIQQRHPEIHRELNRILAERVRLGNAQRYRNEAFTLLTLTPERPEITIGRLPENDLVIDDPQVAAIHARIRRMDGQWLISDEGSVTGTYVNRKRIDAAQLRDGDEVLIATNRVFLDGASFRGFEGTEACGSMCATCPRR